MCVVPIFLLWTRSYLPLILYHYILCFCANLWSSLLNPLEISVFFYTSEHKTPNLLFIWNGLPSLCWGVLWYSIRRDTAYHLALPPRKSTQIQRPSTIIERMDNRAIDKTTEYLFESHTGLDERIVYDVRPVSLLPNCCCLWVWEVFILHLFLHVLITLRRVKIARGLSLVLIVFSVLCISSWGVS